MQSVPQRPKLLLFDLDGTLLDDDKNISPRNLAAIRRCRDEGIVIGVATARSEATSARYVSRFAPEVLISNSGGLVRVRGQIVYQCGFTADEAAVLVGAGVAEHRGITVDCADTTYCSHVIDFFNEPGMTYTDFADFRHPAFKICIEGTDTDFAERTAALVEDCAWLAFSDCDWFKFSKSSVSKGSAIVHAGQALGIALADITAFGDDYVDTEMLRDCGVGVAMGNAVDGVKKCADVIIGNNNSDAIADYIENYVL